MKKYRTMTQQQLLLSPKKEYNYSRQGEAILISKNGKVFLHWYSKHGNLSTTYTLEENHALLCQSPVQIINGSDELAVVNLIEL